MVHGLHIYRWLAINGSHLNQPMNFQLLLIGLLLNTFPFESPAQTDILDVWNTGRGGFVKIYECGDKLCGELVASEEPDKMDVNNPDPSKRDEKLIGHNILSGFTKTKDNVWKKGKIYNPNSGKYYKAKLTLEGDQLKVRGYKGISLFGKTVEWTRQQ